MPEKYLCLYPSGEVKWVEVERVPYHDLDFTGLSLDKLHQIIGCDCIEHVRTILPGIVMIIDESGRIKNPPQLHNELASWLYYGYIHGGWDIVGPAVICAERPDGDTCELNLFPLTPHELRLLTRYLGVEVG